MKHLRKILAAALTLFMAVALATPAFAQTVPYTEADAGQAKITITNASKGETYKVAKLFDASVTGTENGSVRYTGTIPSALSAYFEADTVGNISAKGEIDWDSEDVQAAFKSWAESNVTIQADSEGDSLEFTNLPYGYYIVTTTQGDMAVTVWTTNPNATIVDKNTTPPVNNLGKSVDEDDEIVSIGESITYTITFNTANYDSDGNQIDKYVIEDTLPSFLTNVSVTSITIDNDGDTATANDVDDVTTQFASKQIELTWATNGKNLYDNGALVTIVYTATVTDDVVAGGSANNENTVTVTPYHGSTASTKDKDSETEKIFTYAFAIQKVDENGDPLPGASFQIPGLTVTGSNGNYTVVSYNPDSTDAGTTMQCDDNGLLVVRGVSNEATLEAVEVDAPDGYNKLDGTTGELTIVTTGAYSKTTITTTTTTTYYDSEGNVVDSTTEGATAVEETKISLADDDALITGANQVENNKGTELPSTGGIGTTIFYVVGGVMVAGAIIMLITKRRMASMEK